MMALDRADMGVLVQRQLVGRHHLTYSTELSLFLFIFLVIVSMGAAIIWALVKMERKIRGHIDRHVEELKEDEE